MSLKNKAFQTILAIICGLFFILAIFLGVTAAVYAGGDGAPNIFGSNVYLVKTDAFGFLHSGTAIVASKVPNSEIQPTNIVIFTLENGKPALAQVITSNLYDGVYSFNVLTENNAEITLSQSQVVAKGMSYSDFLGGLISFATSPFGMLMVAIVPSIIMIILEIIKFAGKIMPQPEIETIKKQYEVPTYSSADRPARERRGNAEAAKAYRNASLDNSIGIYDTGMSESAVRARRPAQEMRGDYAEIAARQQAAQQNPLFTTPTRRPQPQVRNTLPLSSKKLNEAIEATKAEHELEDMKKVRSQIVKDIQKTRGAAIAAEKEFERSEKIINEAARKTADLAKTAVLDELSKKRTSELSNAAARAASLRSTPAGQPPRPQLSTPSSQSRRIQRPGQKPAQQPEENVRQYNPGRVSTSTTTSIPRLDSLLREDSDSGAPYNIDDILAGLDRHGLDRRG
jgi:hypothetical protein